MERHTEPGAGGRLDHLDALRGAAILLVVYVHIVNYGLFDLKQGWNECLWSPAVTGLRFRMPLFFFVSGFLACGVYDAAVFRRRLRNRLSRQLWPTAAVCLAYGAAVAWSGWDSLLYNKVNEKYWFTQSLVQVFVLYAAAARICNACKARRRTEGLVMALLALALLGAWTAIEGMGKLPKGHFLSYSYLNRTCLNGPFFFMGVLARMWRPQFESFFERRWPWLLAVVYFAASCAFNRDHVTVVTRTAGVLAVYGVFHHTRRFWGGGSRTARAMRMLGRNTLPVYLCHYVLLHPVFSSHMLVRFQWLYGTVWEVPAVLAMAWAVSWACIGLDSLWRRGVPQLHTLVYGT